MRSADTGVFIEIEGLRSYAVNVAAATEMRGAVSAAHLAASVMSSLSDIRSVVKSLTETAAERRSVSKSEEWLLDNWYIAERGGKRAARDLRRSGDLPGARGAGRRPALSMASSSLVIAGRGVITEKRIDAFFEGFQNIITLSEAEISTLIPIITAELILFLRSACRETGAERELLFENVFTSLRFLGGFDAAELLRGLSRVEETLRKDPAGIYALMSDETRGAYRREISHIALRNKLTEEETAKSALQLAEKAKKHIGHYIFVMPLGAAKRKNPGSGYIAFNTIISLFIALFIGLLTSDAAVFALSLLPISELVKISIDALLTRIVPPRQILRMELPEGVPQDARTICTVSLLLTSEKSVSGAVSSLEGYMLTNRDSGKNLAFAILADLPEAKVRTVPGEKRTIEAGRQAVEQLNKKYGGGFYFLFREREYNETDKIWMASERKRGAILELCRLLAGEKSAIKCLAGDRKALKGMRYIIALDIDTRLTSGSAREMVGAASVEYSGHRQKARGSYERPCHYKATGGD